MDYISAHSFKFGQTDMWEAYGIRIEENGITEDTLLPQLRARKVKIPQRSGAFDFGAKFYDERSLTLNCFTLKERERYAMRGFLREVAFALSAKGEIRLWNEAERYYIGRVYSAVPLEPRGGSGLRFSLTFVCEPYAYGATHTENFTDGVFEKAYEGTAPTPTLITIRNLGTEAMTGIVIKQTDLRG